MIRSPPWLAAGREIGHVDSECQSRMQIRRRKSRFFRTSTEFDGQSDDDPDQSQNGNQDTHRFEPIAGGRGARRASFDPLIPGFLGFGTGSMVMAYVPGEPGILNRGRGFHKTDG